LNVFVETSVFIASHCHSPEQAKKIEDYFGTGSGLSKVSSLVVRQELKRRMLGDLDYLYRTLVRHNSYQKTYHHLVQLAGHPHHGNRARIGLGFLGRLPEESNDDKFDRLKARLRRYIISILPTFDGWLDRLETGSGCSCGQFNPRETTKNGKTTFEIGNIRCSEELLCPVGDFVSRSKHHCDQIATGLRHGSALNERAQIQDMLRFLAETNNPDFQAAEHDPCYTVGDLLITLESLAAKCAVVYTMNRKDFIPLCTSVGLTARILFHDPDKPDEENQLRNQG
jgi:hypothetical protein